MSATHASLWHLAVLVVVPGRARLCHVVTEPIAHSIAHSSRRGWRAAAGDVGAQVAPAAPWDALQAGIALMFPADRGTHVERPGDALERPAAGLRGPIPNDLENEQMTATETTHAAAATDTWNQQLAQLKARYKHVREPVLVALNILMHDQNIALEDAKAQANLHGVRITVASINAARTLLSRMDSPVVSTPTAKAEPSAPVRSARRARPAEPVDAEALVRGFVAKLRGQGNAEAERLRDGIRKAIAVLQAATEA